MNAAPDLTGLLIAWSHGDRAALDELVPFVHRELHRLAHQCMFEERAGHPLQTTALINEAYLRLVDIDRVNWRDRAHFLSVCARLMRRILVDFARSRESLKRGGGITLGLLDDRVAASSPDLEDLLAIDTALEELSGLDPRKGQVIELRFFGGLSIEETAQALGVSTDTVMRDWRLARVWLLRALTLQSSHGS